MNSSARLNRVFATDGKCVVAVAHGLASEARFLRSIEGMPMLIAAIVSANPDAVLLSPGWAPIPQSIASKVKPLSVILTDIPNVYRETPAPSLFDESIDAPVEQAL
jgi:DhnA family fructose-bisphosphate aldolase class Ia